MKKQVAIILVMASAAACARTGHPVTEASSVPSQTPIATYTATARTEPAPGELVPISASNPSVEAAAVFQKCHVGATDMFSVEQVIGMGEIPSATELVHYVPLTGREPQLADPGPFWVVQLDADVTQPGGEVWTDPTCVVTTKDFGFFATGPVKNASTGAVYTPLPPAVAPDRTLPPLVP